MPDLNRIESPFAIADALRALPLETPGHSAWPRLAQKLALKREPPPRPVWPLGLLAAAALAAVAVLPHWVGTAQPTAAAPAQVASAQIGALRQESARLEALLAMTTENEHYTAGPATLVSLQFEEQLQSLDAELAVATEPTRALPLWQERVAVLRDYAGFETTRASLSAQGDTFDGALVAAY